MGFFSLQTTKFMQALISKRHAVIRSMCAQLPFVLVSNDTCCSIVSSRLDATFVASQLILFEMELLSSNTEGL